MKKAISLYCDESCHLKNNGMHAAVLGYIGVPHNSIKKHKAAIAELRRKHNLHTEIKWTKVANKKALFYIDLLDYFFESDMLFRGLLIPTGFFGDSKCMSEKMYYRLFGTLLSHQMNRNYEYNIYIDMRDTRSFRRMNELKDTISDSSLLSLNKIQPIRSYESSFLQLADVIIGALAYDINEPPKELDNGGIHIKRIIIEKILKKFLKGDYETFKKIDKTFTDLYFLSEGNV